MHESGTAESITTGYFNHRFGGNMRAMIFALGALAWSPAQSATTVTFDSDSGDYIGAGQYQVFSEPAWSIAYDGSTTFLDMSLDGPGWWYLHFRAPRGSSFATPQGFAGATRYPFNSPTTPGLSVSGEGRGCNTLTGWFEVLESLYDTSGKIARLALDFKQNCEGGPSALYGAVRINSDIPVDLSAPHAIAVGPRLVFGRDVVVLDGRNSFNRAGNSTTYAWEQLSGTSVSLRGDNSVLADFVAPLVAPGGETLVFRLTTETSDGRSDSDTVEVHVASKSDPQTYIYFDSEPGDYIGGGREFRLSTSDGDITASENHRGGVSIAYNGDTWYHLDFGPPEGTPFVATSYEGAQRFAFADSDRPGIDVGGDGRGCNTITGRFDVRDVLLGSNGVARFAVDFEQHCEGGTSALFGSVRYNHIPEGIPLASAGADQTAAPGDSVVLDGSASSDDQGLTVYRWRQSSGPAVALQGADTSRASFTAPTVESTATLAFELLVADGDDLTAVDTTEVLVSPKSSDGGTPPPNWDGGLSGSSGGGAFDLYLLTMLLTMLLCRVAGAGIQAPAFRVNRKSTKPRTSRRPMQTGDLMSR